MQLKNRLDALRSRPFAHMLLWQLGIAEAQTQTTDAERDCLARYATGKKCSLKSACFTE